MNLDEMPGRELDTLIAEKVMGWHIVREDGIDWWFDDTEEPDDDGRWPRCADTRIEDIERWSPSTDIAAAWEIVERLRDIGILMTVGPWPWYGKYRVTTWNPDDGRHENKTIADTASLAICRVALKAIEDR